MTSPTVQALIGAAQRRVALLVALLIGVLIGLALAFGLMSVRQLLELLAQKTVEIAAALLVGLGVAK